LKLSWSHFHSVGRRKEERGQSSVYHGRQSCPLTECTHTHTHTHPVLMIMNPHGQGTTSVSVCLSVGNCTFTSGILSLPLYGLHTFRLPSADVQEAAALQLAVKPLSHSLYTSDSTVTINVGYRAVHSVLLAIQSSIIDCVTIWNSIMSFI